MPSAAYGLRHPASASCLGRHSRLAGRCPNNSSLFPPLAALASCWPLPQQLLPVSATGGGRRRCSGRIILIFGIAERLRTLRYPIFTGGVVMANGIYSACFLRKRRRCGESSPTQHSKAVRHSPDGLAALIGKNRSGDGNCYFARPSFFSRFHARMTCTLVTRLPGVKAPSPMSGSSPASTAQRAALAVSGSATSL